jgi:hypothetical protein
MSGFRYGRTTSSRSLPKCVPGRTVRTRKDDSPPCAMHAFDQLQLAVAGRATSAVASGTSATAEVSTVAGTSAACRSARHLSCRAVAFPKMVRCGSNVRPTFCCPRRLRPQYSAVSFAMRFARQESKTNFLPPIRRRGLSTGRWMLKRWATAEGR